MDVVKTYKTRDLEVNKSIASSATGERQISWISHTDNGDGTYTRVKDLESSVSRTRQITNSLFDEDTSLTLNIATVEGQAISRDYPQLES